MLSKGGKAQKRGRGYCTKLVMLGRQNPSLGCIPRGSCNNTLLRKFLEDSFKEMLLRRVVLGSEVLSLERFLQGGLS